MKQILMNTFLLILMGSIVGGGTVLGQTETAAVSAHTLPRSFEGARLGMSQYELTAAVQHVGRIAPDPKAAAQRTVIVQPKDRHLQRIEYRLHHNVLREMVIAYRRDRVPGGYEGLLGRLKDTYGQPAIDNLEEYDPRPDVYSVKKTVWKDQTTTMQLSESRRFSEGQELYDLVLTIADRALQQAYEDEQAQQHRRRVFRVPIPLSDTDVVKDRALELPRGDSPADRKRNISHRYE